MSSQRKRREDLVQVQEINQFVYCARRHYYLKFFDTIGQNYELAEGTSQHDNKADRGGWTNEMYLRSDEYNLHGKIDVLEEEGSLTPVEHKRSESGTYFESDELQLTAYCMLLEDNIDESVTLGYIYTRSNDKRHPVRIRDWHRNQIREIVRVIQNMAPGNIPPLTDNPNKCEKCSTRQYCMPYETAVLEPEKAEGTGWEDRV